METALLKILQGAEEEKKADDAPRKEQWETLSAYSLDSILTSLKEVRMEELAAAGKRYRVVSDPDKVAITVLRLLGMPSPPRVTEVEAPPDTQEATSA